MSWKYVQRDENGKYRTTSSGGGGGGASALTDLDDVSVSSPTDGQILTYDDATDKWVNSNPSSGHTYSTTEQVVGTWIDGKPIYEKTVTFNSVSAGTTLNIPSGVTTVDTLVDVDVMCSISGGFIKVPMALLSVNAEWGIAEQSFTKSTGYLRIDMGSERSVTGGFAVFRYTKTTD